MKDVPRLFWSFISSVINVAGDGNCGYRVVANFLYKDEEKWLIVRQQSMAELELNKQHYISVFEYVDRYKEFYESLPCTELLHLHHSE